jgi:lysozyme
MADWEEMEKQELKADEGLRLKAYKDKLGILTIGYGHTSDATLKVTEGLTITEDEADSLLDKDFEEAVTGTQEVVPFFNALDGPRKGALVNMCFQMGAQSLSGFHGTLNAMDEADWDSASKHIMSSKYARQTRARATRIAYRIRTGQYAVRV